TFTSKATNVMPVTTGTTTATQSIPTTMTPATTSSLVFDANGLTSISVAPGTAPRVDFAFLPASATASLTNCGPNGTTINGITASTTFENCSAIKSNTTYVLTVTAGATTANQSVARMEGLVSNTTLTL